MLIAFALIAATIVAAATEPHSPLTASVRPGTAEVMFSNSLPLGLEPWVSALIAGLALHLLAVVRMCLKRTRAAYQELKG